ncbi:MAG: Sua5/YciO/YrdC/YwlC family protein, partial [Nocardioidaceae bacterium]
MIRLLEGYHGQLALVDVSGAERKVNIGMLEDQRLGPGDWVLIHMGFAVERVDATEAAEAMAGLELMGRPRDTRIRRRFHVTGLVQGVGFRPFVYVTARDLNLTGSVVNDSAGVIAEVEGTPQAVGEFARRLRDDAPVLANVESVLATDLATTGGTDFVIGDSSRREGARTLASPDIAMCDDCSRELLDPDDRRYRHPFITCTNCGPRFTIIKDLPYDRPATTMAEFPLCAVCAAEYSNPTDRRFHAQPIACRECGPRLEFVDADGSATTDDDACLALARSRLAVGGILAIKGLGGYHLACDATNADAVAELRRRKQRGDKPFAVMAADLSTARELVHLSEPEAALITDPRRPIVLVPRRDDASLALAPDIAPDNPDLGIMLPYTPLHLLLFGLSGDAPGPRVLVMT